MNSSTLRMLGTVGVVIVIAVAAAFLLYQPGAARTSEPSTTTAAGQSVAILSDNLTVGFQSGLWSLSINLTAPMGVTEITAILSTPVQTEMCTGANGGLRFTNCPSVLVPPFAPGTTITSFATGAGPGSATVGSSYKMSILLVFEDGASANVTSSVVAQAN